MTLLSEVFGTAPVADTAVAIAWKSTAILVAVISVMLATWRRPTISSAIAGVGHVALIILPLLILVMPPLLVRCLPPERTVVVKTEPLPPLPEPRPELPLRHAEDGPLTFGPDQGELGRQGTMSVSQPVSLRTLPAPARGSRVEIRPTAVLLGAYVAVVGLMLARLAFGLAAVSRLRRQAVAADEPEWLEALERWRTRLGIRRRVGLAWSSGVSVPVAIGWLRPMVLLPASAGALEVPGHADAILVHELAHIRRGDFAWNVIQRLAVSLYWLHPLAWLLAKGTAAARERACDDLCIHEMGGPAGYRATLLAVASGLVRRPGPALGMAMARSPRLARRLMGIDRSRGASRCLPRGRARAVIAATALVVVGLVGAARLTRAGTENPTEEPKKSSSETAAGRVLRLRVVSAATGKPIPKANVRIWIAFRSEWKTTDDQGTLAIRHSTGPGDTTVGVDVWGDGFAMQRHNWESRRDQPIPDEVTIRLMAGETLGGLVRDDQGRPITGATVYLWSHNYKHRDPHELLYDLRAETGPDGRWKTSGAPETTGELTGIRVRHPDFLSDGDYWERKDRPKIADLRAGNAVSVMTKGIPIRGRVVDADGQPVAGATVRHAAGQRSQADGDGAFDVSTDSAGRFLTAQLRSQEYYLIAMAPGHGPGETQVKVRNDMPEVEIRLGRRHRFAGRVVDPLGKPVKGAFVDVDSWRGLRFLGTFFYTDKDGRFHWDDATDDELVINVLRSGYVQVFNREIAPTSADLSIVLKPALTVKGIVRNAETRRRVREASIEYAAVNAVTGEPLAWVPMPTLGFHGSVASGELFAEIPIEADSYKVRILADGFEPFLSRTFRSAEDTVYDYDIDLIPRKAGAYPHATVVRPDGKPLAGARVHLGDYPNHTLIMNNGEVNQARDVGREIRTGVDGTFPIMSQAGTSSFLILGDDCYAVATQKDLEASPRLRALPYARIEGRSLIGSRPSVNETIGLSSQVYIPGSPICMVAVIQDVTADGEGRFRFDRVICGRDLRVTRQRAGDGSGQSISPGTAVRVAPGQTAVVTLGGTGLPVIGRVEPPEGWTGPVDFSVNTNVRIESNRPVIPFPLGLYRGKSSFSDREQFEWSMRWRESPEGRDYQIEYVDGQGELNPDGSFRIEDVPPGEYRLSIAVGQPQRSGETAFVRIGRAFTVPRPAGGRSDRPLNLGTLTLQPRVKLKTGDPAPAIEIATTDGKKRSVPGDFRGKFLLLDFGTMWDMQSPRQITRMNDIQSRFGKNEEFALLSLTLAEDTEATRRYIAEKGEAWPQAIVGSLSNPIAYAYGVSEENVPAAILIGPDGKILDADIPDTAIRSAVEKALSHE